MPRTRAKRAIARLELATVDHAPAIVLLRNAVATALTLHYGKGHWSSQVSERGVLYELRTSRVFIMRRGKRIIASLRLGTKKPWAIDTAYFTACERPIYLTDMAVEPSVQRQGIGRLCIDQAREIVRAWPADAIRLDAYDATAGAGAFYAKCGFREVGRVTYRSNPLLYFEMLLERRPAASLGMRHRG
ncbi:MAG: GNAT family N-acetyltransferase [Gemmatimonadaceae bacterium]